MYLFKRDDNPLILKYYQCLCKQGQGLEAYEKDDKNMQKSKVNTNKNKFKVIRRLIEQGNLNDLPHHLFADDYKACGKIFNTLTKFYAHLRLHSNEKPYVCPVPNCK